jgi:CheY-specific phosphatase CheX
MTILKTMPQTAFPAILQEAVVAANCSTLETILGNVPKLLSGEHEVPSGLFVIGLISFMGDHSWSCAYILPEKTAEAVAEKFVGFEIAFNSSDMADVIGELANVIAGDITAQLDRKRIKAQMSLPSVSRGENIEMLVPAGLPTKQLEFSCTQGRFWNRLICAPQPKGVRLPGA